MWQIFVRNLHGDIHVLQVEKTTSVESIKATMSNKWDIPIHQILLVFQGKEFQDGMIIADLLIGKEYTIHLIVKKDNG